MSEWLRDDDWEKCSFCDKSWTMRKYESVTHCAAHTDMRVRDLRRERDEAQAELETLRWRLTWAHELLRVYAPETEHVWQSPPEVGDE